MPGEPGRCLASLPHVARGVRSGDARGPQGRAKALDRRREDSAIRGSLRRTHRTRHDEGSRLHPGVSIGESGAGPDRSDKGQDRAARSRHRVPHGAGYGPPRKEDQPVSTRPGIRGLRDQGPLLSRPAFRCRNGVVRAPSPCPHSPVHPGKAATGNPSHLLLGLRALSSQVAQPH